MTSAAPAPLLTERAVLLRLRIIVSALAGGVAFFAAVAWFIVGSKPLAEAGIGPELAWFVLGTVALGGAVADRVIRTARLARLREAAETARGAEGAAASPQILAAYQEVTILRAALIEAPCLIACVFFLLTADERLLIAVGAGLAVFVLSLPSGERLRRFAARAHGVA